MLKILAYIAVVIGLVGAWGVWHGYQTTRQYSDALFIAGALVAISGAATRMGSSSSVGERNLYIGTVTGKTLTERMERAHNDLLGDISYSTRAFIVGGVLFLTSALVSLF